MVEDESGVQRRITAFWERVAQEYDSPENENVATPGTPAYSYWTEALTSMLPDRPARVLDVGTGTGFAAGIASQLGHQLVGIDASAQMVALARGKYPDVRFTEGDAVHPPFPPARFDVVLSRSLIWTLRELDTALTSWFTLLAPAGRLVAIYGLTAAPEPTTPAAQDTSGIQGRENDAAADQDVFTRHYTPATQAALDAMHLDSHDRLITAAQQAAFTNVESTALTVVRGWQTSPGSHLPYALTAHHP